MPRFLVWCQQSQHGLFISIYRVGQKEVHRDYRLVRLNGTWQIYDFLHKCNTEGGKTDASELGARQCKVSRKIRFVSRHTFWPHHCRKLGDDSCQTSSWNIASWNLPTGSKLVQKLVKKFRNLGTVDKSKSPGEVGPSDHQHRASCRLRPAEPGKVHLASGTGASVERLCEGSWRKKYSFMWR